MKKVLSLVLALALVFSMSVCFAEEAVTETVEEEVMLISEEAPVEEVVEGEAPAEEIAEAPAKEDGEITVKIDGVDVVFPDQKPILHNDRTMVPLRAIFEALGADVAWDNDTNTAMAKRGDIYILIQIDNTKLIKNNESVELDVPAMLVNDRTLVPVRAISEAFGCKVDWVDATLEVLIVTEPAEEEAAEAPLEETIEGEAAVEEAPVDETAEETVEAETEEAPLEDVTEEVAEDATEEAAEEK